MTLLGTRTGLRGLLARWRGRDIELKTPAELDAMRAAGALVAHTLAAVTEGTRPGISTGELDALAETPFGTVGRSPVPGYRLPRVICASVNEEIVHGIPSRDWELADGDLISVDCGAILDGWHGDAAVTMPSVRSPTPSWRSPRPGRRPWHAGYRRRRGPAAGCPTSRTPCRPRCARSAARDGVRYGIVAEYGGHGIGTSMHMDPFLPNLGEPGKGPRLRPGMALAVEPMLTAGDPQTRELDDGWTVVTDDGARAVH